VRFAITIVAVALPKDPTGAAQAFLRYASGVPSQRRPLQQSRVRCCGGVGALHEKTVALATLQGKDATCPFTGPTRLLSPGSARSCARRPRSWASGIQRAKRPPFDPVEMIRRLNDGRRRARESWEARQLEAPAGGRRSGEARCALAAGAMLSLRSRKRRAETAGTVRSSAGCKSILAGQSCLVGVCARFGIGKLRRLWSE
jgi:hypothetical protein